MPEKDNNSNNNQNQTSNNANTQSASSQSTQATFNYNDYLNPNRGVFVVDGVESLVQNSNIKIEKK